MPDFILAALVLAPVLITYFLKSNAALSFLALCTGFVLSTSVIGDLKHLLSETNLSVTNDTLAALLITLPFLFTLVLTGRSYGKAPFMGLHLLAALAGGALLVLSLGPLLVTSVQFNITNASLWPNLAQIQAGVIGIGALLSLVVVWIGHKPKKKN